MPTDNVTKPDIPKVTEIEEVPSDSALSLKTLIDNGFILVQWVGVTNGTVMKLAPSPNGAIRPFGAENYGLIKPHGWLMIHANDFHPRYYRRPTDKEKPKKDEVQLTVTGKVGHVIRVTW